MSRDKLKPIANVQFDIKMGFPEFNYKAKKPFDLTILLICLFLKTRWLLTGQDELKTFKSNFYDIIRDDNFPESIRGISGMILNLKMDMDGKTTITLYKNKHNDAGIISYFPFAYSNIDIINICVAFVDKVTALFDSDAKRLCRETFRFFKDIIIDDNEDESNERLMYLFGVVSEFIRQLENT